MPNADFDRIQRMRRPAPWLDSEPSEPPHPPEGEADAARPLDPRDDDDVS